MVHKDLQYFGETARFNVSCLEKMTRQYKQMYNDDIKYFWETQDLMHAAWKKMVRSYIQLYNDDIKFFWEDYSRFLSSSEWLE